MSGELVICLILAISGGLLAYLIYRYTYSGSQVDKQVSTASMQEVFSEILSEKETRDNTKLEIMRKNYELRTLESEHDRLGLSMRNHQKRQPQFAEAVYGVGVLGMRAAGKSQLLNRLTNYYFAYSDSLQLTAHKDPEVRRLARTEAHEDDNRRLAEYLRFDCYAGEHIKDAITALQRMCFPDQANPNDNAIPGVHGLIIVLDLAETIEEGERQIIHRHGEEQINRNLDEFPEPVIKALFQQPITNKLKAVIIFINKCDTVSMSIEALQLSVRKWFSPIIENIRCCFGEPEVIVGSVKQEIGLTQLFAKLVQLIFHRDTGLRIDVEATPPEPMTDKPLWLASKDLIPIHIEDAVLLVEPDRMEGDVDEAI